MILLSFDIEEFEMPREYGDPIPFEQQIQISKEGSIKILDLLQKYNIKGTFYTTANFAIHASEIVKRIVDEGHELASHGYYHDHFEPAHLKMSKDKLEEISGVNILGYRMARMAPVPESEIYKAGYKYNSSINPTFLPGRYNKLNEPRTIFRRENVWQIPVSVTPILRIPLFWLSFHNFPLWFYQKLAQRTIKRDSYINMYFHPWEFMEIGPKSKYNFPFYITKNTNDKMVERLDKFIKWALKKEYKFEKTSKLIEK